VEFWEGCTQFEGLAQSNNNAKLNNSAKHDQTLLEGRTSFLFLFFSDFFKKNFKVPQKLII
jgi:hypothetical protein